MLFINTWRSVVVSERLILPSKQEKGIIIMSKSIDSNKQFMIGNGILAFGVFIIVCLFMYLGFRYEKKGGPQAFPGQYTICMTSALAGDSLLVYLNDSLLTARQFDGTELKFQIGRFAEESLLMVVDGETEAITPFNLSQKGSIVTIDKRAGKIFIEEQVAQ